MNNTLQTALAWFGAFNAISYIATAAWICTAAAKGRPIEDEDADRKPITEAEIAAVDFDVELAKLTKENGR